MKDLAASLGLTWENGLNAGESMAGGNTTAHDPDNHAMKGPGSGSVYPRPETTDAPDLEISVSKAHTHAVKGGNGSADHGIAWTEMIYPTTGFTKAGE